MSEKKNAQPDWVSRGKTIRELILGPQTFENQEMEVRIFVDDREAFLWLMVDQIGDDYPGIRIKALRQTGQKESRPAILSALHAWRTEVEASQATLVGLPRFNELRPPSQLQRQFGIARSRQMDHVRKEAPKDSIKSQIATQIPLKAGRRLFNRMRGAYSEPSELQMLSCSVELPPREVLDSVGNATRSFQIRNLEKTVL
ncbi:MAG: hypothetical protein Q8R06_13810 [Polaromonas sp.]|uniref:hypothetical protein n=1 Tax=Polaromonas sp. TaxID=1869339 RepID=UPI00273449EC|nr:hypothetical protein [Polaromonas sp.]MDP3798202.1 hypothetical protein [Polaromonas sp.]